jgi:hypothetical protein
VEETGEYHWPAASHWQTVVKEEPIEGINGTKFVSLLLFFLSK